MWVGAYLVMSLKATDLFLVPIKRRTTGLEGLNCVDLFKGRIRIQPDRSVLGAVVAVEVIIH